jgi:5-methylcytosine-specific restriction endonuclease McrA
MARQTKEEIAARAKTYRAMNREQITAREYAYRAARREENRAARREGRVVYARSSRGAAKRAEAAAQFRSTHRDDLATKARAYYAANREKARSYCAANREKIAIRGKAYIAANPDKTRAKEHLRRARKMGNGGRYTFVEWRAMCAWFGNVCLRCGGSSKLSIDHVVPLAKGGANTIANLQPLCKLCNSIKHTKIIDYRDPVLLATFLAQIT